MKTYEEANKSLQRQAVESGGIAYVDGKELTGKAGYYYLDGELVTDVDAMLEKIAVDDWYIKVEMGRE